MSRVAPQAGLVLGGQPRVELLPPEVALRERARATRRRLIGLLVVVLLVVVGGYGLAVYRSQQAQSDLAAAQARTAAIQAERQKYASVTSTDALIADINAARTLGASTEIVWSDLLTSIQASLPAGVTITSANMKDPAPWETPLTPAGPLRQPRVATLSIVISSPTIFDATDIVRSLVRVPGFADATPDSVTGGSGGYSTTITLNVNDKALSGRFASKGASK